MSRNSDRAAERTAGSSDRSFPHFMLFVVVFVWYELLLRIFCGTPVFFHFWYPLLFDAALGLLCGALTSLFGSTANKHISEVILIIIGIFFIVECIINRTYQNYMTISSMLGGAGNVVGDFRSEMITAVETSLHIIFLYMFPVLLYIVFGSRIMPAKRRRPVYVLKVAAGGAVLFAVTGITAGMISPVKDLYSASFEFDTATQAYGLITGTRLSFEYSAFGNRAAESFTGPVAAAKGGEASDDRNAGEYGFNVLDIDFDSLIEQESDSTVKKIHEYVSEIEPTNKNEYTGLFEGKNLILIAAESFSEQCISSELTPMLYRMANEGIKFTDFYQPAWGGSTSTGEYSILLGLVPTDGVTSFLNTTGKNVYYTMGNMLGKLGYSTVAFHNGHHTTYNRDQTHHNLGYDEFLTLGSGLEEYQDEEDMYFDSITISTILDNYVDEQPFSWYWMTFSGHCAYMEDDERTLKNLDYVRSVVGDQYEDTTLYYLCYNLELEYAMETLVGELEEEGIADDTVIVICPDHYPYGLAESSTFGTDEDYLLDLYGVDSYDEFVRDRTSLIIWSESIEGMGLEADDPCMSVDILPTLLNLFGVEYDSRLLAGRDVFSDAMPLVIWSDYSFLTDRGSYDALTGTFTPVDGTEADDDYIKAVKTEVSNRMAYSSQVFDVDYFEAVFGQSDWTDYFDTHQVNPVSGGK